MPSSLPTYSRLIVRDMRLAMPIGIFEEDKTKPCPLLVNLTVDVADNANWQADDFAEVLGYDKLVELVRGQARLGHRNLLETFGEQVIAACFALSPLVEGVTMRIEKPEIFPDAVVGIELSRKRP